MTSQWTPYQEKIIAIIQEDPSLGYYTLASKCVDRIGVPCKGPNDRKRLIDNLRRWIKRNLFDTSSKESNQGIEVDSTTDPNDYPDEGRKMTAWHPEENRVMDIEEYCHFHGLNYSNVSSFKFISHTGVPFYNIVFREENLGMSREDVLRHIEKEMRVFSPRKHFDGEGGKVAVHAVSDIHLGQKVQKDEELRIEHYNVQVAMQKLRDIATTINAQGNGTNNIILNGDIMEAVQLMHISQYREIDPDLTGVEGIKLASQIIHECLLNEIENIGTIYLPSSNHGRLGGMNKEENERGQAENMIAYILQLRGYKTVYSDLIGKFKMGNISVMYSHGHLGLMKKSTPALIREFGYRDNDFVLMISGHTHDPQAKGSDHNMIRESRGGHMHLVCPPLTTGGEYSANIGHASCNSGFISAWPAPNGRVKFTFEPV